MMMAYGMFVFAINTAAYQELQRASTWRQEPQARVGRRPARQYLGPGDDTITLAGILLPEFTGGQKNLDVLREMAQEGHAWPLVEGHGTHYGLFVIRSMSERKSVFFNDGKAQRIEFDLSLERVDEDNASLFGQITPATLQAITRLV